MDGFASVTNRAAPGRAAEPCGRAVSMRRPRFVKDRAAAGASRRRWPRRAADRGRLQSSSVSIRPSAGRCRGRRVQSPLLRTRRCRSTVRGPARNRRAAADGERSRHPRHRPRADAAAAVHWRASACPARRASWAAGRPSSAVGAARRRMDMSGRPARHWSAGWKPPPPRYRKHRSGKRR